MTTLKFKESQKRVISGKLYNFIIQQINLEMDSGQVVKLCIKMRDSSASETLEHLITQYSRDQQQNKLVWRAGKENQWIVETHANELLDHLYKNNCLSETTYSTIQRAINASKAPELN